MKYGDYVLLGAETLVGAIMGGMFLILTSPFWLIGQIVVAFGLKKFFTTRIRHEEYVEEDITPGCHNM